MWTSTIYPSVPELYSIFWCWNVISRCDLDLWPAWYIKRHVIKVCTKLELNRAIPGWINDNFGNFYTVWCTLKSTELEHQKQNLLEQQTTTAVYKQTHGLQRHSLSNPLCISTIANTPLFMHPQCTNKVVPNLELSTWRRYLHGVAANCPEKAEKTSILSIVSWLLLLTFAPAVDLAVAVPLRPL